MSPDWRYSPPCCARSILVSLVVVALFEQAFDGLATVGASRTRLGTANQEPSARQVHDAQRVAWADPNYYHLRQAGLLRDSDIDERYQDHIEGRNDTSLYKFQFNSADFLLKQRTFEWMVTLEERVAMHVYDDPRDRDLATGPQVDQDLCGLHLAYMQHMVQKYRHGIMNTTEYSVFRLMNAFDFPHQGMTQANAVFPGDYDTCMTYKLNVMRRELAQVDKQAADKYFEELNRKRQAQSSAWQASKWLKRALRYVRPFLGGKIATRKDSQLADLVEQASDQLHLLPMRYCMAGFRWPEWPNSTWSERNVAMRVATCLPETCDSKSLTHHYDKIKRLTDLVTNDFHRGYYIGSLYCLPDEQSPLRNPLNYWDAKLFIFFQVSWCALLVSVTILHRLLRRQSKYAKPGFQRLAVKFLSSQWWFFLRSWSILKNLREFLAVKQPTGDESGGGKRKRVDLRPLEGLKVFGSYSVMLSHAIMLILVSNWNRDAAERLLARDWLSIIMTVCPSTVNIFFVITGALTARTLLQTAQPLLAKPRFWLNFFIYRYIRIVPLYLLFNWGLKSCFRFLGAGPFWDYSTSFTAWMRGCQNESLWTVLVPQANFISPSIHCEGTGWYLANDLHFSLLTPIFVNLLMRKPLAGHLAVAGSVLVAMANHVRYYYNTEEDPRGLLEWGLMIMTRVTDTTTQGYINPQYRFVAYVIGLSAGHLLYEYERNEIKEWPPAATRFAKWLMFVIAYSITFLPFLSSLLLDLDARSMKILAAVFSGTVNSLSSLAIAIFIVLLTTGHFRALGRLLSGRACRLLASMSLSSVLVHLPLMYYHAQTLRVHPYLSGYNLTVTQFVWFVESLILAFVVHIMYEMPIRGVLVKLLLNRFAITSKGPPTTLASDVEVKAATGAQNSKSGDCGKRGKTKTS